MGELFSIYQYFESDVRSQTLLWQGETKAYTSIIMPIEGLLVGSSVALTPLLREDNTGSPSIVAITTFTFSHMGSEPFDPHIP